MTQGNSLSRAVAVNFFNFALLGLARRNEIIRCLGPIYYYFSTIALLQEELRVRFGVAIYVKTIWIIYKQYYYTTNNRFYTRTY